MFCHPEDLIVMHGPVWHGTALGWKKSFDQYITKLPIVCERFSSVKFFNPETNTSILLYSSYLPTAGNDEEFLEVIETLNFHINENKNVNDFLVLGLDSNVSEKSTKRRYTSMNSFVNSHELNSIITSEEPTFHHNNKTSESQIDHVYFSPSETLSIKLK